MAPRLDHNRGFCRASLARVESGFARFHPWHLPRAQVLHGGRGRREIALSLFHVLRRGTIAHFNSVCEPLSLPLLYMVLEAPAPAPPPASLGSCLARGLLGCMQAISAVHRTKRSVCYVWWIAPYIVPAYSVTQGMRLPP